LADVLLGDIVEEKSMSYKKDKAKVIVDDGQVFYAYTKSIVWNEIKPIINRDLVFNKDTDPLKKDLCSPEAMKIALKSLEDE
jgi:hypothetical protein